MTRYNSSEYRVLPLLDRIKGDLGAINKFLSLVGVSVDSIPITYFYGANEKKLKPTKPHLLALIDHIRDRDHCKSEKEKERYLKSLGSNPQRSTLFFGSKEERAKVAEEAKELIEKNYNSLSANSGRWYSFEAYTHPDVFIEGEDYIILCEAKWTERGTTSRTTYLCAKGETRSQMIRHIQGALNYSDKRIIALYIVDAECNYLKDVTKEAFAESIEKETIPISAEEKTRIIDSFYGFTTWQEIEKRISGVSFLSKEEIDRMRKV